MKLKTDYGYTVNLKSLKTDLINTSSLINSQFQKFKTFYFFIKMGRLSLPHVLHFVHLRGNSTSKNHSFS